MYAKNIWKNKEVSTGNSVGANFVQSIHKWMNELNIYIWLQIST